MVVGWIGARDFASRAFLIAASLVYAWSIHLAYARYVNPVWEYFGFTYRPLDAPESLLVVLLVLAGAAVAPVYLGSASSVVLLSLFVVVFVPTIVVTMCLDSPNAVAHLVLLTALAIAYVTASSMCPRLKSRPRGSGGLPRRGLRNGFLLGWVVMCGLLVAVYGDVMALVSWYDVYEQRAAGASKNALVAYTQTYFSTVVSPTLLALGLVQRKAVLTGLGTLGCLVMYMITAQKLVILLPVLMTGVWMMVGSRHWLFQSTGMAVIMVAAVVAFAATQHETSIVAAGLAVFLVQRTIAIPGLALSQYYEVFSHFGYTGWAHVKGIGLLVKPTEAFVADPLWPGLGYIVGERLSGDPAHNMNANLFAGDGVAAAGAAGVLIMGLVLGGFLRAMDVTSRRWDHRFVVLVMTPIALALTNGHLSTVLLSFGGFFWLLVFRYCSPRLSMPFVVRRVAGLEPAGDR
jgi:hypothetical protein